MYNILRHVSWERPLPLQPDKINCLRWGTDRWDILSASHWDTAYDSLQSNTKFTPYTDVSFPRYQDIFHRKWPIFWQIDSVVLWHSLSLSRRYPSCYVGCTEPHQEAQRPESSQDVGSEEEPGESIQPHKVAFVVDSLFYINHTGNLLPC